jgi:hypothetical protein
MIIMKSTTSVRTPNSRSVSLITGVPREVKKALGLEKGDKIDWLIEADNNELKVSVIKSEE